MHSNGYVVTSMSTIAPAPPSTAAPPTAGVNSTPPPTRADLVNSIEFARATIEVLEERVHKLEAEKRIMRQEHYQDATLKLRRIQELDRRVEDLERENERLSQHLQWFTARSAAGASAY
jgi:uncharacterized small protein (DUF1192 family)